MKICNISEREIRVYTRWITNERLIIKTCVQPKQSKSQERERERESEQRDAVPV